MALRDLSTQTMVTITAAWIDPKQQRPDVDKLKKASFLLSTIEEVHNDIVATQATTSSAILAEITAVQKEQAENDSIHDRKSRGIHGFLTALAELTDDSDKAARYLALRDKLFTQGLVVVNWSYTDEAGEAELVEGRLSAEDRALLKQLSYHEGNLFDAHEARISAAQKLGELQRKKQDLVSAEATREGKIVPADVRNARNAWIRAVRAFMDVVSLEKDLSEEARTKILGPLEEAERKAARRGGKEVGEEPKGGGGGGAGG